MTLPNVDIEKDTFEAVTSDNSVSSIEEVSVAAIREHREVFTLSFVNAEIARLTTELDFYTALKAKITLEAEKVALKEESV